MELYGRRKIFTDEEVITADNLIDVLNDAMLIHLANAAEINELYNYYKGRQAIQNKVKTVRAEINHKVTENRANEIVSFKTGHLVGEPIQYTNRTGEDASTPELLKLNEYCYLDNKESVDKELVEWMFIAGTAYKLALPNSEYDDNAIDESPFKTYIPDPRSTFVVYNSDLDKKKLLGVKYVRQKNDEIVYYCWTKTMLYIVKNGKICNYFEDILGQPHDFGYIPIIEYPANNARLGAFEIVVPIIDAINMIESNRVDAVDQFVQSLMLFCNCDIDEETFAALKEMGALKYTSDSNNPASVQILTQELNQMQTQTLVDYMYQVILTICGMPNRNGGTSTSDTGSAVIMRDGWSAAEARARDVETLFKASEKEYLKLILHYLREIDIDFKLPLRNIKINFTRRNYENINQLAETFVMLMGTNKVHPKLAFLACSALFGNDPEEAYKMSKEYYDEQVQEQAKSVFSDISKEVNQAKQKAENNATETTVDEVDEQAESDE